jgi:hypothetical protein
VISDIEKSLDAKFTTDHYGTLGNSALSTIDVSHARIHEGNIFEYSTYDASTTNGDSITLELNTGTSDLHATFDISVTGNFLLTVYETVASVGDTTPVAYKINRNLTDSATTIDAVLRVVTIGTASDPISTMILAGGKGNQSAGGTIGARNEWLLKKATKYYFVFKNISGNTQAISATFDLYKD